MQTILKAGQAPVVADRRAVASAPRVGLPAGRVLPARPTLRQDVRTAAIANPAAVSREVQEKCINAIRFLSIDGE